MLGNVWEWCEDLYRSSYCEAEPTASAQRIVRGGSWYGRARAVRAATRSVYIPANRLGHLGFRCAEFKESVVSSGGSRVER